MKHRSYDIVIIGSGAGGGTVAQELSSLCRDGVRIAVLEKGPKLHDEEFTGREVEMAKALYEDGGGFLTAEQTMTLAFGSAYGGSTVVYTGTSLLPPERVLQRWNVPGLAFSDVEQRARKYTAENNVHLLEESLLNQNNRLFVEGCRRLGYRVQQFPVNLKGCQGSSLCNLGCPNQAKQGTHRVQLPRAERNGVEVVTRIEVQRIENKRIFARVSEKPEGNKGEPSTWEAGDYQIDAKVVVVCAVHLSSCIHHGRRT
jgi:choline dehydrogenase-like flavoprotein